MDKTHGGSGSASPAPLSSSPALKSTPIPEATEAPSYVEQSRPELPPTKSPRGAVAAEPPHDSDKNPLNVATSTISEWFGVCIFFCSVFLRCRFWMTLFTQTAVADALVC